MRFAKLVMPDDNIDVAPFIQLCVNVEWAEILMSVMSRLEMDAAWENPEDGYRGEQNALIFNSMVVAAVAAGANEVCGCCEQTVLHRVGEDGELEISTDGGVTWRPDPNDPRVTGTQLPNTIPGEDDEKKCNAANNAIGNFKDAQASFGHSLSTATTIIGLALAIAAEIVLLLLSAGTAIEIILPLVISTATALFGVLEADYNAEFTEDVWNDLTCDIFCTVGDDGQFTSSQLIDLQALVDEHYSDNVALTFQSILRGWGTVGLNNACIAGSTSGSDCSGCDCDCGGEEIGLSMDLFFGDDPEQTGCNVKASALADGDGFTVSWQWDGSHPFKLIAEGLISGAPATVTWQWYLSDGSGPFTNPSAPIGASMQVCNLHGTGETFRTSWDVATP